MLDAHPHRPPARLTDIERATKAIGFTMASGDGAACLSKLLAEQKTFDLVFADTWAGKDTMLNWSTGLIVAARAR